MTPARTLNAMGHDAGIALGPFVRETFDNQVVRISTRRFRTARNQSPDDKRAVLAKIRMGAVG